MTRRPTLTGIYPVRNINGQLVMEGIALPPRPLPVIPVAPAQKPRLVKTFAEHLDGSTAGCRAMLEAMLYSGQHYHATKAARIYASKLGFDAILVKPGIGA